MNDKAQGLIEGLIFVGIAIIFVIIVIWGILNLNIWAIGIGSIALFFWGLVGFKSLFRS